MPTPHEKRQQLRELLDGPKIIRSMGAHDVFTALLLEEAGFQAMFLGGFGAAASLHGLPDLNFLGLDEMAAAVRRMATRVDVPVIADADTGYGDLHNVARTVEEFERAGAAGLLIEDQVFPKRCHFEKKAVIPADEMILKIRAAVRAKADDDLVIVARTDARAVEGLDSAIDRVNRACDAGADIAFIEAPESVEELEEIARRVPWPKFANMLSFGKTPILTAQDLEDLGYKFVVAPIETLLVAAKAILSLSRTFLDDGDARSLESSMMTFDEIKSLLGLDEYLGLRDELSS